MSKRRWVTGLIAFAMALVMLPCTALAQDTAGGGSSAVAQIGDKTYTTLIDAVNAAEEGDTIKLLQDYTIATKENTHYNMPKGSTLDLGGKTLTVPFMTALFQGVDITIQNGTFSGEANYGIWIGDGDETSATLINLKSEPGVNVYDATATLKNCEIQADSKKYYAVWADEDAIITIESGTYTEAKTALMGTATAKPDKNIGAGKIEIKGGDFTFTKFFPADIWKNITVYGGTFSNEVPSELVATGYEQALGSNAKYLVGKHELKEVDAVAPTCTKDGQKAYWVCSTCGQKYSDKDGSNKIDNPIVDPATGHTLVKTDEVAATCTEAGHKAYWTCSTCKALFSDGDAKTQIDKPEAIAALGHTLTKTDEVAATCTTDGQKAYWTCSTCKKLFSDEAGKTEIKAPETIKALGHKLTKTDTVASTCKDKGHEAYWTCSTCKKLFSDAEGKTEITAPKELPLADHTYGDWTVTKAATETETGTKERVCKVCGKVETADVPKITPQAEQKVVTDTLTNDDISEEMAKSGYDTTDKIESALATTAAKTEGYTKENTTVSEVKLLISTDDGESWFEATEDNFPTEGLKVTLDYPEGTDSSYDFVVAHMFSTTSSKLGTKAGDIETPAVKKTKTGIQVTLKGLSPVSISWKQADPIVFIDVDSKTDHSEDINWLAATGVSTGWAEKDGTRTFRPYWNIARADMAAFLYRLAGSPEYTVPSKSPFVDCNENMAHYKEICWLAEMDIAKGWTVKDGKEFRPYEPIARADMAAFLYRLAGRPEYTAPFKSPFTDCTEKTDHYKEVCWLAGTEVSEGWTVKDGKEFRAYSNVARADMAAFLHRMSEKGLVKDYE